MVPPGWETMFPNLKRDLRVLTSGFHHNPNSPSPPRLWIERVAGGFGDIIHMLSAVEDRIAEFKEECPDGEVTLCVPRRHGWMMNQFLTDGATIDYFEDVDTKHFDLYAFIPSRYFINLLCPCDDHEVETNYQVTKSRVEIFYEACQCKAKPRPPALKLSSPFMESPFPKGQKVAGVILRSIDPYKDWGMRKTRELCLELQRKGYFVVTFDKILSFDRIPAIADTTMEEVSKYLQWCDIVVGPDTGPLFVASALGVHTFGIFGKTNGYYLLEKSYKHGYAIQITRPRRCLQPCYGNREFRGFYCDQTVFPDAKTACMEDVRVGHVLEMIEFITKREGIM